MKARDGIGQIAGTVVMAVPLLFQTSVARADISGELAFQATSGRSTGTFVVELSDGVWGDGTWTWDLDAPVPILAEDGTTVVATLLAGHVLVNENDVEIELGAGVLAEPSVTDFVISTPQLSFPTIPADSALGRAVATISLTDTEGPGGYALIHGTPLGTGIFRSQYNGATQDFADLVGLLSVDNGGTASGSESRPPHGFAPYNDDVYGLSALLAFTLTASDVAFATTLYAAVPEPGTLGLFGLAVLGLIRRR